MDYLTALLNLAYTLGYDGLPPGEGGPIIDPTKIKEITLDVEGFIIDELIARRPEHAD